MRAIRLVQRDAKPSAKKPNIIAKITKTLKEVANPQRRKHDAEAPIQLRVRTVRVDKRSLKCPNTSRPTIEAALWGVQSVRLSSLFALRTILHHRYQ